MTQFLIETDRLILREFTIQDAEVLFQLDSNPKVHKYLGNRPLTHIDQIYTYINSVQQQYIENGIGRWITLEKATNEVIGWSGLKFIREYENNQTHFYDVGYRFMPKYWSKGYATEATKAALRYGFQTLKTNRIIGIAHEENKASRRVLEKCGLHFVEHFMSDDIRCVWLSITQDEWNSLNKTE